MNIKLLKICDGLYLRWTNARYRDLTNEERYEGWMRSDFRSRTVFAYDNVDVVREMPDGSYQAA